MTPFEHAALERLDISHMAYTIQCTVSEAAMQWERPSVMFRPAVSLDGDMYCVLYGQDLMAGVAGFGATMEEAHRDFDKNWYGQKAPQPRRA